jgi:hypothetical protein
MANLKFPPQVWRTFQYEQPTIGQHIEVQYGHYPPQVIKYSADCHCPGHGQIPQCQINYGTLGLIHICNLVWRPANGKS